MKGSTTVRDITSIVNFLHEEDAFSREDENDDSRVTIKKCRIRRQRKIPKTNRYECAMEFTEIVADQQKKFSALFYQWQRDYLRKRRLLKS